MRLAATIMVEQRDRQSVEITTIKTAMRTRRSWRHSTDGIYRLYKDATNLCGRVPLSILSLIIAMIAYFLTTFNHCIQKCTHKKEKKVTQMCLSLGRACEICLSIQ